MIIIDGFIKYAYRYILHLYTSKDAYTTFQTGNNMHISAFDAANCHRKYQKILIIKTKFHEKETILSKVLKSFLQLFPAMGCSPLFCHNRSSKSGFYYRIFPTRGCKPLLYHNRSSESGNIIPHSLNPHLLFFILLFIVVD